MLRHIALFVFSAVCALAAESGHTYSCVIPANGIETKKGGFVGYYYVDGVVQPGYCTASTSKGWSTTSSISVSPSKGLDSRAPNTGVLPVFRLQPTDTVCSPGPTKGIPLPPNSPGPTVPCGPADRLIPAPAFSR